MRKLCHKGHRSLFKSRWELVEVVVVDRIHVGAERSVLSLRRCCASRYRKLPLQQGADELAIEMMHATVEHQRRSVKRLNCNASCRCTSRLRRDSDRNWLDNRALFGDNRLKMIHPHERGFRTLHAYRWRNDRPADWNSSGHDRGLAPFHGRNSQVNWRKLSKVGVESTRQEGVGLDLCLFLVLFRDPACLDRARHLKGSGL